MNEPDYSIPLLLQDPRVVGRRQADGNDAARLMRQADEIEDRRGNVLAIAIVIADTGQLPPVTLTSLQLAVEMLRNAEQEKQT